MGGQKGSVNTRGRYVVVSYSYKYCVNDSHPKSSYSTWGVSLRTVVLTHDTCRLFPFIFGMSGQFLALLEQIHSTSPLEKRTVARLPQFQQVLKC